MELWDLPGYGTWRFRQEQSKATLYNSTISKKKKNIYFKANYKNYKNLYNSWEMLHHLLFWGWHKAMRQTQRKVSRT